MRSYGRSVKAAARGLLYAFSHEANFRTEVVIALSVVLLIFVLDIPWQHAVVLLFLILVVLVLEIVNTVVERVVDILKPRIHPYARIIKDLMAAAVLLSTGFAFFIGGGILLWYLLQTLAIL